MSANDNTGDNSRATNLVNNENVVITVNRDNDQISRKSSPSNKGLTPDINVVQNPCVDNENSCPANKSSNRNAINFMGYFILVLIIFYGYFGSLIGDIIGSNDANKNDKQNQSQTLVSNPTQTVVLNEGLDFETKDIKNDNKFYRNITSTELIVILWFTVIYGSALLLYLRFRVLTLERDPNSEKNKKKDSTEELNIFLAKNRKNKRSFKDKILNSDVKAKDNSNEPFWQK